MLGPARFLGILNTKEQAALFAHELVHIARRDRLWKLMGELVCRVFFFQPLNRIVQRRLKIETEFVADEQAALLLEDRTGSARCLTKLCEWWMISAAMMEFTTQRSAVAPVERLVRDRSFSQR